MKESRNVNQANGNALINAADISRHYTMADGTVQALSNVSLTVNVGEFIAITGPSGSGKSTLMNILGLLDTCDSGTYMFSGLDTKTLADNELSRIRNERIGFIFQSFNLIPTLSVVENVALPLTYRGIPTAKRLERSLSALEAVGLSERLSHKPYELSGGQQQRVAIARALAAKPAILLADEPTGNLDSCTSQDVMGLLKTTSTKFAQTIVMITHNEEIAQLADRIIRIEDGRIVTGKAGEAL